MYAYMKKSLFVFLTIKGAGKELIYGVENKIIWAYVFYINYSMEEQEIENENKKIQYNFNDGHYHAHCTFNAGISKS